MRTWWWADSDDGRRGRHPYSTVGPCALGGEVVRMEIAPTGLSDPQFRGWSLVAKAYTRFAVVTLSIDDGQDGG